VETHSSLNQNQGSAFGNPSIQRYVGLLSIKLQNGFFTRYTRLINVWLEDYKSKHAHKCRNVETTLFRSSELLTRSPESLRTISDSLLSEVLDFWSDKSSEILNQITATILSLPHVSIFFSLMDMRDKHGTSWANEKREEWSVHHSCPSFKWNSFSISYQTASFVTIQKCYIFIQLVRI
jgi:hypothetical protein